LLTFFSKKVRDRAKEDEAFLLKGSILRALYSNKSNYFSLNSWI